jgi:hypothetical protein
MPARQRTVDTVRLQARGPATGSTSMVSQPVSTLQHRYPVSRSRPGFLMLAWSAVSPGGRGTLVFDVLGALRSCVVLIIGNILFFVV